VNIQAVSAPPVRTVADLLRHLGSIPAQRVRIDPAPGEATVEDVIHLKAHEKQLCELVDGVLVEKVTGVHESLLAGAIIHLLWDYLEQNDRGVVLGADGAVKILGARCGSPMSRTSPGVACRLAANCMRKRCPS